MITLITGTPGAGKSLYAVNMIVQELIPQKRLIFANINGLRIPQVWDCGESGPMRWQEYPDGTIFIFDEVQRQWPAERGRDVPMPVRGLDTHRHRGIDFYLITQSPMGIDPRVRRLVGRHIHLHRAMGMKYARVMDWPTVMDDPRPPNAYDDGARHVFKYPRKLFDLYDSASMHTVRPRIPWQLAGPVLIFAAVLGMVAWNIPTAIETYRASQDDPAGPDAASGGSACFPVVSRSPLTVRASTGLLRVPQPLPARIEDRGDRLCARTG